MDKSRGCLNSDKYNGQPGRVAFACSTVGQFEPRLTWSDEFTDFSRERSLE